MALPIGPAWYPPPCASGVSCYVVYRPRLGGGLRDAHVVLEVVADLFGPYLRRGGRDMFVLGFCVSLSLLLSFFPSYSPLWSGTVCVCVCKYIPGTNIPPPQPLTDMIIAKPAGSARNGSVCHHDEADALARLVQRLQVLSSGGRRRGGAPGPSWVEIMAWDGCTCCARP